MTEKKLNKETNKKKTEFQSKKDASPTTIKNKNFSI